MLKFICLFSLFCSTCVYASPMEQMLSTKEKIRISLWFEGIESEDIQQENQHSKSERELPEEIERALIKM